MRSLVYLAVNGDLPGLGREAMSATNEATNTCESQETCSVVVVYDCNATRARAMAACDYLVQQIWGNVELDFHWWRTDFLQDASLASLAAENAIASDFLIICSGSEHELPFSLSRWFEGWVTRRGNRFGALVDLGTVRDNRAIPSSRLRENFLRKLCQQGGFDYLTAFGMEPRTAPISPFIDEVLGGARPPSHFGLNE